jgi:hypothetical protein
MSEAESQQRFFELMAVILEWMPYVTLAGMTLIFGLVLLYIWFRKHLHKKGIMHRNYDGLEDGYTWIHLITGKRPPDQHLWEQDAERVNRQSAEN